MPVQVVARAGAPDAIVTALVVGLDDPDLLEEPQPLAAMAIAATSAAIDRRVTARRSWLGTGQNGRRSSAISIVSVQLDWTQDELLATDPVIEPLVAAGRRCHGGFAADGRYVSPRTQGRIPAIEAWQSAHVTAGGTLVAAPIDEWPEPYPNVAQSRYLLEEDVSDLVVTTLTRIGTVEGFGGLIRHAAVEGLQRHFDDSIAATTLAHLTSGLFEAHARDETGHGDEAGHKEMWFAARDIAFDRPFTDDETARMLDRMGIPAGALNSSGPPPDAATVRAALEAQRVHDDLDPAFEAMIRRMLGLMFIEVSAFHTFAWAEELLGDDALAAGDGEAARLVSYIRTDETPHVEYLRTAISEIRDRTLVGESGRRHEGRAVIDRLWAIGRAESLGPRRDALRQSTLAELECALAGNPRADEIRGGFHERGSLRPTLGGLEAVKEGA